MARRKTDPLGSFNFLLEINGVQAAGFSEVTGLDSETDIIEYREGNEEITVRKLPGLRKFANVTLKRGLTSDLALWQWRQNVMNGKIERQNVTITVNDESREKAVLWDLRDAWPSKWTGPELKANANEVAIETLEFCHEGITKMG